MKSSHWTILAAVALILPAYCGVMLSGVPTLISPFPIVTFLPALILSSSGIIWIAVLVPAILFMLWNPALLQGQPKLPKRSLALLTVLTVLSLVYLAASSEDALRYQGAGLTYGVLGANLGWLLLLWAVFVQAWRNPSFAKNLLAHWLLFAWMGWYAFPYWGELP